MAPPSKRAKLLPVVLEWLRQGRGQDDSARLAGVDRHTLQRWMNESPSVRRRVRAARRRGGEIEMARAALAWAESHQAFLERAAALQRGQPGRGSG